MRFYCFNKSSHFNWNSYKQNDLVKKEIVKELKEDAENLDLIKVDIEGLVSMMNEEGIYRYDTDEFNIEDIIQDFIQRSSSLNSFFLMDIGQIFRRYKLWKKLLPNIDIYYAVKCNPDKVILKTLSYLGIGFDVASKSEISMVDELEVQNGMIFANPVKEIDHIMYARSKGITMMTFDSEDELKKISVFHPTAELILRIRVDDSRSKQPFGSKFGCPMENLNDIFLLAKQLSMNIIGISFHVGSGGTDPSSYEDAIVRSREVFKIAESNGFYFRLLDIGGGFPGHNDGEMDKIFELTADTITTTINKYFSDIENLRVVAEPGRFFATSCGTLVTNIIGKKIIKSSDEDNKIFHYYINSNLYGMFNNILFDKAQIKLNLLNKYPDTKYQSVVFGQTCDSLDLIKPSIELPELACGDWLYVNNHGAYTTASASTFNGFFLADVKYIYTF